MAEDKQNTEEKSDREIARLCVRAATKGKVADQLYEIAAVLVHGKSPAAYAAARIAIGRMRYDALSMADDNGAFLAELDRAIDAQIATEDADRKARGDSAVKLARAFVDLLKSRPATAEAEG